MFVLSGCTVLLLHLCHRASELNDALLPEEGPQILQQTGLAVSGGNAQLELDRVSAPSQEPLRIAEIRPGPDGGTRLVCQVALHLGLEPLKGLVTRCKGLRDPYGLGHARVGLHGIGRTQASQLRSGVVAEDFRCLLDRLQDC